MIFIIFRHMKNKDGEIINKKLKTGIYNRIISSTLLRLYSMNNDPSMSFNQFSLNDLIDCFYDIKLNKAPSDDDLPPEYI